MAITKGSVFEVTDKGDVNYGYDWPDRNTTRPRWANGDTGIMYWRVYGEPASMDAGLTGWQKCPVCEGSGKSKEWAINEPTDCPTCEGKRIIDKLTGKPPK